MIDPKLFTVEKLLAELFDTRHGNRDIWRSHAEIIVGHMPPFPQPDTRPRTVVRFGEVYLRYSKGPGQGHIWDVYGDDYLTPELALIALLEAPIPPGAIHPDVWERHRAKART
jgi:hypothetical protein